MVWYHQKRRNVGAGLGKCRGGGRRSHLQMGTEGSNQGRSVFFHRWAECIRRDSKLVTASKVGSVR